jgi:hypothetical protein
MRAFFHECACFVRSLGSARLGSARLETGVRGGLPLSLIGAGFGELALLSDGVRAATATAASCGCSAIAVDKRDYNKIVKVAEQRRSLRLVRSTRVSPMRCTHIGA